MKERHLLPLILLLPLLFWLPGDQALAQTPGDQGIYLPLLARRPANRPPAVPANPSPPDGATGVARPVTLSWQGGDPDGHAVSYAVFLGTAFPPIVASCSGLTTAICKPPSLAAATTYYWRVVATDSLGAQTAGPVWSFTTAASSTAEQFAAEVVRLANQERAAAGCAPLAVDSRLEAAALGHSEDMALNDFVSHTGSDGSSPADRVKAEGYDWSWVGENIAAGYTSPASVVAAWMDSDGHRANILNCQFTETGVGYIYLENDTGDRNFHHYWTHVFARPLN